MPEQYTIKNGDTLTKLARKFGTTVAELAKANNIEDPDKIYIGDNIMIPQNPMNGMREMVQQMLQNMKGQGAPGMMPQMPPQLRTPQNQTMAPMGGQGGGVPSPQQDAIQPAFPEAMMGLPGMLKGVGGLAAGGLAGLAGRMPPAMGAAGRIPPPAGYSNIAPMGNSGGFNSSMAQAMLNGKGGLNAAANFRGIPPGLRNPQTEFMMRGNPERMMGRLGQEARMNAAGPKFGPSNTNPEAVMLEEMLARRRFGG